MKRSSLCLAKRAYEITSSFVAMRTNLIPSFILTHAAGEMASVDSKPVTFFLTINTLLTGVLKGTIRLSSSDTNISELP